MSQQRVRPLNEQALPEYHSDSAVSQHERMSQLGLSLLESPQQLTAQWLTAALQLQFPDSAVVRDFTIEPFSSTDFDITVRLHLTFSDASPGCDVPAKLLLKMSKPLPSPQWSGFIGDVSCREAAAYRELSYHNVCRVPSLYFSAIDHERFNFLIEDNGSQPAVVAERKTIARQKIDAVLSQLALLHGCFARYSPVSAADWLIRPRDNADWIAQCYRSGMEWLSNLGATKMPTESLLVIQQFSNHVAQWHRYDRHILTMTHGDVRHENMLFEPHASGYRATLLGWKLAGLRCPMFDVASLLSNGLTPTDRRAHERQFIERYRKQFEQSGTHYSAETAQADYAFNLFAPLIFNVCAAGFLARDALANDALLERIERNCRALIFWRSEDILAQKLNIRG